jgi:phosphoribosylformylglycinamidine cyclo-ligase
MSLTYKDAGVDLEQYEAAMDRLPSLMRRTHTPRVLPLEGGFAGLFRLMGNGHTYADPVLVSGTDGVGTKLKVAFHTQNFRTVGIDLVAMCVNDVLCVGAEPLFFLDYLALGKDNPDLIAQLVEGVSAGCCEAGAALIGGETAIMPDIYAPGEFDMAGFCVGVVERSELIDGSRIQPGDLLLGVDSSGIHSNGFSLVRKIVFDAAKLTVADEIPSLGATVGNALLTPTRIYAKLLAETFALSGMREQVAGIAHITGGGLADNIARLLPANTRAVIDRSAWQVPAVFGWLQELGQVEREEMFRVFNMGIGLVLIIRPAALESLAKLLEQRGERWRIIGEVVAGETGACYLH